MGGYSSAPHGHRAGPAGKSFVGGKLGLPKSSFDRAICIPLVPEVCGKKWAPAPPHLYPPPTTLATTTPINTYHTCLSRAWCCPQRPHTITTRQAWRMEILEDGPYFGQAPVALSAGPPWWASGQATSQTIRDV